MIGERAIDPMLVASIGVAGAFALALGAELRTRPLRTIFVQATVVVLLFLAVDWRDGNWPAWQVGLTFIGWTVILASFPDGQWRPAWTRLMVAGAVLIVGLRLLTGSNFEGAPWAPLLLGCVLVSGCAQVWRYRRRSSVAERESTRWLVLGFLFAVTLLLAGDLLRTLDNSTSSGWARESGRVASLMLPVGAALGFLAPRHLSVDPVLQWVMIVAGTALTVLFVISLGVNHLHPAAMAAAVALVMLPAVYVMRRLAERLVYGAEARPLLTRLGERLEEAVSLDEVAQTIASSIRTSLQVTYAAVSVEESGTASSGGVISEEGLESVPVVYQGRQVGMITVGPRPGEQSLTNRDRAAIQHLARRAAATVHGVMVVEQLRAARERVLRARDEERSRIRRDLHDDLAPTLAGLSMTASALSRFLHTDQQRTAQLARELLEGLHTTAMQVRDIAYGLRPPELDDGGLIAAIQRRLDQSALDEPPTVRLYASAERFQLPEAVELAAFRIILEAVTNARRHSQATLCEVRLSVVGKDFEVLYPTTARELLMKLPSA